MEKLHATVDHLERLRESGKVGWQAPQLLISGLLCECCVNAVHEIVALLNDLEI
jgi:hypothetical protein